MLALAEVLAGWATPHLLLHGDERGRAAARRAGAEPLAVGAEPAETLEVARTLGVAALVVDSYAMPPAALAAARAHVPVVVAVDDVGGFPLPVDVVVNAALGLRPPPVADGTRYLLGPRFALLARAYAAAPARGPAPDVRRVFLALGGATGAALMRVVAAAVRAVLPRAALDVVVGPAGDGPDAVADALEGLDTVLHVAPEPIRPLMLGADLAVSAAGVTAYELAATATPTIGVTLAANQVPTLRGFAEAGALWPAGDVADARLPVAIQTAVSALAADPDARAGLGARSRALVDGLGAVRVADAIRARLGAGAPTVPGRTC